MAIKYLAGNRIIGTAAERTGLTTNLEIGTIFEESDTGKHYMLAEPPTPTTHTSDCATMLWTTEGSGASKGTLIVSTSSVFYGKQINDVQFYCKQNGTTGTAKARIFASSTGATKHEFWSMNISDIDSGSGAWTDETSTPYTGTITTGDIIGVTFSHPFSIARSSNYCVDGSYSGYASSATDTVQDHTFDQWYKITVVSSQWNEVA